MRPLAYIYEYPLYCTWSILVSAPNIMKDYREYKQFYKFFGFFVLIAVVFIIAFKVSSWVIWAHQCINASL